MFPDKRGIRTTLSTTLKMLRQTAAPWRTGSMTQKFFAEGDDHEATEWKHAQLPPDDAAPPDAGATFESFDKIPRTNGRFIAGISFGAGILLAYVVCTSTFGFPKGRLTAMLHKGAQEARGLAHPALSSPEIAVGSVRLSAGTSGEPTAPSTEPSAPAPVTREVPAVEVEAGIAQVAHPQPGDVAQTNTPKHSTVRRSRKTAAIRPHVTTIEIVDLLANGRQQPEASPSADVTQVIGNQNVDPDLGSFRSEPAEGARPVMPEDAPLPSEISTVEPSLGNLSSNGL